MAGKNLPEASDKIRFQDSKALEDVIRKYIPEIYDASILASQCGSPDYTFDTAGPNKAVAEPIWDIFSRGGKRLRLKLFALVLKAYGKDPSEYYDYMVIPEFSHNGTLIVDDIEDNSTHRRGEPCLHLTYGTDVAVNAGNALYFLALLPLLNEGCPLSEQVQNQIFRIYFREMVKLHYGQGMDITWHKGLHDMEQVTEDKYLQMTAMKTGALYRMSVEIACVLAGAGEKAAQEIGRFASHLGVAYQICDDILDIQGDKFARTKGGQAKDITEAKITIMIIHALRYAEPQQRERLKTILGMHTQDTRYIQEAVAILQECGSPEYASSRAREIIREAWQRVEPWIPEGSGRKEIEEFAGALLQRNL